MRRVRAMALIAVAAVSILAFAGGQALAAKGCGKHRVPPGNSQVSQYIETGTVPGSCGNQSINPSRSPSGQPFSSSTSHELQNLGPAGAATAQLAAATAPPGGSGGGKSSGGGSGKSSAGGGPSSSIPAQVGSVLGTGDSSGGMGFVLPLIIGVTILAGVAYLLHRRRRSSSSP